MKMVGGDGLNSIVTVNFGRGRYGVWCKIMFMHIWELIKNCVHIFSTIKLVGP